MLRWLVLETSEFGPKALLISLIISAWCPQLVGCLRRWRSHLTTCPSTMTLPVNLWIIWWGLWAFCFASLRKCMTGSWRFMREIWEGKPRLLVVVPLELFYGPFGKEEMCTPSKIIPLVLEFFYDILVDFFTYKSFNYLAGTLGISFSWWLSKIGRLSWCSFFWGGGARLSLLLRI